MTINRSTVYVLISSNGKIHGIYTKASRAQKALAKLHARTGKRYAVECFMLM